ncbi:MAG: carbohydrate ABC transporter permease, partial [Vallitaleaceae bacterium]|nr:carbohydrate ABC transporter permease [Vallitaleaceae bacterium]
MKRVKSYQLKPMNILRLLVLIALTVTTIVPFLVLILVSLKTQNDFMINPLGIPEQWNFGNYVTVFVKAHVGQAFFNSVKITSVSVVLQIIFGSMVGYALIKMNFKHANKFASLFLLPMVFPIQTILIPIYII